MTDQTFQDYANQVYGWAYRLLGRHHDALDVVQDVFLKWSQQCAADRPDKPRGWLRRVTLNRAIDLIRGRSAEAGPARIDTAGSPSPHLVEPLDASELRLDIAASLERLSEAQRAVLIAKVYDELTFSQIAEEMDLAVPTVKTHYLRALAGVRDRLRRRWADEVLP